MSNNYIQKFNKHQQKDLEYGDNGELTAHQIINNYFDLEFKHTEPFHNFDFYYKNIYVEVKSRRVSSTKYNTLFFTYSKYQYIKKYPNNEYYFIFNLTDGFFLWKFKKDQMFFKEGGRTDRGKNERYILCNVPTKYLTKISD